MSDRISLVYILSNGHSGTTLLDLLLGAHRNVWTLGEAQILPWELMNRRAPCGCGTPIEEDDFWKPLLSRIPLDTDGYHIGYFRNRDQVGKVLRWKLLPDLLRGEVSPEWQAAVQEYAENNAQYFQVVRNAAEERTDSDIKWLVDNSKDPYRLFWLQQSQRFDIRVIHLMKDPRSYVCSTVRNHLPRAPWKMVRYTGRWIIENALMRRLVNRCFRSGNMQSLAYEQLAAAPEETMSTLGNWLGISYSEGQVHTFREAENHAVSGNMMRWRDRDDGIRLDERWKRQLPSSYAGFIQAVAGPFASAVGYPRSVI